MGRSDLLRRAMSKKKGSVMEKERKNFVYGNPEENVPGCVNNGIDEKTANHIYDEMIDFAKYAFNKSHAVCYAVVAYETAYLKYYYPVEFMAALMTSVIDNPGKTASYILTTRQMGIKMLPPDINEGERDFSVSEGKIRYALSAIKGIGPSLIDEVTEERKSNGMFLSLRDFIQRMSRREMNKRAVENFIKAGAMDSLEGTRKQKMQVYAAIMDEINREKKQSMQGQMSLFDFVEEEQKAAFEIHMPDVGEFDSSQLLAFEKEVLGIYISGHPLEEDEGLLKKNITARSADFIVDEETDQANIQDGAPVTIGGMITSKTIKATKTNQMMAFITLEDLVGTVEVILFPRDYEKNRAMLEVDNKVFIRGRASVGEEAQGKLICEKMTAFSQIPREVWIQFENMNDYQRQEKELLELMAPWDGKDAVFIFLKDVRQYKKLPASRNIDASAAVLSSLKKRFGEKNIKLMEKTIENL